MIFILMAGWVLNALVMGYQHWTMRNEPPDVKQIIWIFWLMSAVPYFTAALGVVGLLIVFFGRMSE